MKQARLWVLGAAFGSFAAGVSMGILVAHAASSEAGASEVDTAYERQLAAQYGLTPSQDRSLRLVMQNYRAKELAVIKSLQSSQLPRATQSQLLFESQQTKQRIRALLDDQQRARYDKESEPVSGIPEPGQNR